MRHHLFYKLDYGFKWHTQGSIYKHLGKEGLHLYFIWKGGRCATQTGFKSGVEIKVEELIHGKSNG